jgi:hypothetical protein
MLTEETIDRLERAAQKQIGHEMSTAINVTPGELLELVRGYRFYAHELERARDI